MDFQPTPDMIFGSFMPYKITEDTWVLSFMNGSQYLYLLEGEEKALLIDTGWGASTLKPLVERLTDKKILVANTHFHPDHAGANGYFDEVIVSKNWRVDAPSVETAIDKPDLAPFDLSKMPNPNYKKVEVGEGDEIDLGDRIIKVLEAADAHCNISLFFYDEKEGLFFTGDEFEAGQVNLFDNSVNPEFKYDVEKCLKNFRANAVRIKELMPKLKLILPNHNGSPLSPSYIDEFIEMVDKIYAGTATIEDELNHPYIVHDPQAPFLCRVRNKNASIFIRKDEVMKVYGSAK